MRTTTVTAVAMLASALCHPLRASAQRANDGPSANATDFAWLAGTWEAHAPGATFVLEATYNAPKAGVVNGVMRIMDQGKVLMIELITITDSPTGPELRFRHFNAQLDALEPVFKQNFRLAKSTTDRYEFENAVPYDKTLMSTEARNAIYTRHGADEFVGHSDVIDESGKADVIEFTWRRK